MWQFQDLILEIHGQGHRQGQWLRSTLCKIVSFNVWVTYYVWNLISVLLKSGLNLGLCPANGRCCYKVTQSLIGWAET